MDPNLQMLLLILGILALATLAGALDGKRDR